MSENAVLRVENMEQYFEEILRAVKEEPERIREDEQLKEKLEILLDYYGSGLWLSDYERDERGEFPQEMKRGILSQDMLYDLIRLIGAEQK